MTAHTLGMVHPPGLQLRGPVHPPQFGVSSGPSRAISDFLPAWHLISAQWRPGLTRARTSAIALKTDSLAVESIQREDLGLQNFLASQELCQSIQINADGLSIDLGGRPVSIARPLTGTVLASAVADVAAKLSANASDRALEISSQASQIELIFADAIGAFEAPNALNIWTSCPQTLRLIDISSWVTSWAVYKTKQILNVKRPSEVDTAIQPILPVPAHASYPSGHATMSWVLATMLPLLMGHPPGSDASQKLSNLAERMGENREVAGLHTAADTAAGKILGSAIGNWLAEMAESQEASFTHWSVISQMASAEWVVKADEA